MLRECMEVFKSELDKSGGRLVLDTYIPADGTYLIIGKDGNIKVYADLVKDKKTKQINRNVKDLGKICFYDYQSQLISMNKPMDSKKIIHSNNYFSFFVKKDSLITGKLTEEIIDGYYAVLEDPLEKKYGKSKEAARIYELFSEREGAVDQEAAEEKKKWIKDHIFRLEELEPTLDMKRKDYLKIFFEADDSEYEREARRYFLPNIYNNNDFNTEIEQTVLGMPDNNLGMNAKKPFLSIKSRKCAAPYLLNSDEVMLQKQFFDYLMNLVSAGKYHVYVDTIRKEIEGYNSGQTPYEVEAGYYLRLRKGKTEAEIHDQDNISGYRRKLTPEFRFHPIVGDIYKKHPEYSEKYGRYDDRIMVGKLIDEIFFLNFLGSNYTVDAGDINIKDGVLKQNILRSREVVFSWVFLGNDYGIESVLSRAAVSMMKSCAENGYLEKVRLQFDLKYSLERYFSKEKGENMSEIISGLREKVEDKVLSEVLKPVESDDEYYYCVGQLTYYLLSLSKATGRNHSLLNPILNAKTDGEIKERLLRLYKKYNYQILEGPKRIRNLIGMVEGYEPQPGTKADQEKILLGYVSDNVMYKKEEK
ncbi:hypothetical protein [Clostridium sp. Marseille-P3244]|uniref:hypothetical protein n=1 Tax=Clostridium sp. Marseille-P3244 TaxID=1871020 RepID=UPI000930869C|nr:hypothetical protein [Clostridium sp. Marseille-P3244]